MPFLNRLPENEFTIIKCSNCGTKNRIPSSNHKRTIIKCGKCGKNPYVREGKTNSNNENHDHKSNDKKSEERTSYVLVKCINCGFSNRFLKSDSYNPSVKCRQCNNNPYRKATKNNYSSSPKSQSNSLSEELDDIIKKHFEGLKSNKTQEEPHKTSETRHKETEKNNLNTNNNSQICLHCGHGAFIYDDYRDEYNCGQCGWIFKGTLPKHAIVLSRKFRVGGKNKSDKSNTEGLSDP